MKKMLSVFIVIALMVTNISFAMAQDNGENENIDTIINAEEIDEETQNGADEKTDVDENHIIDEEQLNNKIEQIKDQYTDLIEQISAFKEEFALVRKDIEARKLILQEIAAIKKEIGDNTIGVFLDGKDVEFDVPPIIKEGRTLVPVRAVVNALGADVNWDSEARIVTITKEVVQIGGDGNPTRATMTIELEIDNVIAKVNGEETILDAAAEINNDRTIVPLRFIAEVFGLNVDWDGDSATIIIEDETNMEEDIEVKEENISNEYTDDKHMESEYTDDKYIENEYIEEEYIDHRYIEDEYYGDDYYEDDYYEDDYYEDDYDDYIDDEYIDDEY